VIDITDHQAGDDPAALLVLRVEDAGRRST
jgi:hypothetical protein